MPTTVSDRQLSGGDWAVYLSEQTAQGAVNTSPAWTPERRTEGRIKHTPSYVTSAEVTGDFNPVSQIQDSKESVGEISFEFTKQKVARIFAAIYGAEVQTTKTSATIASTLTGFVSTDASFADVAVGDFIFVTGFANALINKSYQITAKTNSNTISTYPAPAAVVAASASITVKSFATKNANTPTYYSGQNRVADDSKTGDIDYQTFVDGLINAFSVEIGESGVITGSQTLQFARKLDGTGAVSGQTTVAATTDAPLSAVQNVANWYLNGVTALCELKSATISISNENQRDQAAGCGDRYVRGSNPVITVEGVKRSSYANSMVVRDYFDNGTRVGFAVELSHSATERTVIYIPQCVVTAHDMPDGQNVISNDEFTLTAEKSATLGYSIAVFRNWS